MDNDYVVGILGFALGVFVALNWKSIRRFFKNLGETETAQTTKSR